MKHECDVSPELAATICCDRKRIETHQSILRESHESRNRDGLVQAEHPSLYIEEELNKVKN